MPLFSWRKLYGIYWIRKAVTALFLDFSHSFESINHPLILGNFKLLVVWSSTVTFLNSNLSNGHQRLVITDTKEDLLDVREGVPRDTVRGPVLLHVNYLSSFINCSSIQCSDDAVVYSFGKQMSECKKPGEINLLTCGELFIPLFISDLRENRI